jgi:hypothetical protein
MISMSNDCMQEITGTEAKKNTTLSFFVCGADTCTHVAHAIRHRPSRVAIPSLSFLIIGFCMQSDPYLITLTL